ncbi:MAG: helix-turn-helix domain-containing protein [Solirubrobacteraceae bacterium]
MALMEDRPLRADAMRNRAAILTAARFVFGRRGREAQMDDVARRAKVGVGTLYRHFPTKEALLAALADDRFRQFAEFAQDALSVKDPWAAIVDFTHRAAGLQASDRALSQILVQRPDLMCDAACERGDLQHALATLVERAQAAGVVRADARWGDIPMAMCALSHVGGPPGASWERMLALVLDGLRAPGGSPLPG